MSFDDKLPAIIAACQANDVKRLDLFDSHARNAASAHSDVDFLVEFHEPHRPGVFDRFYALHQALEQITGYTVDLVECSSIESPILRKQIDSDRTLVYAA